MEIKNSHGKPNTPEFQGRNDSYDSPPGGSHQKVKGKKGKNGKKMKKEIEKTKEKAKKAKKRADKLIKKITALEAKTKYVEKINELNLELCKAQGKIAVYEKLLDTLISKLPPHALGLPEHTIEGRCEVVDD